MVQTPPKSRFDKPRGGAGSSGGGRDDGPRRSDRPNRSDGGGKPGFKGKSGFVGKKDGFRGKDGPRDGGSRHGGPRDGGGGDRGPRRDKRDDDRFQGDRPRRDRTQADRPSGGRSQGGGPRGRGDQAEPSIAGLPARQAALDVLGLVRAGASLDEALERGRSFNDLQGADRSFARAMVSTVLRRQGALDHVIGDYIDRPLPKRAAKATDILRLVGVQLMIFETPDHAAVSTATALAKSYRETAGYAGLVNAVARKIAKRGPAALKDLPTRIDTPAWMWRAWERAYGPMKVKAIAAAHGRTAPLDLTPKDPGAAAALAERLGGAVVAGYSVRLQNPVLPTEIDGFEAGEWWVQDAAAALPARLFGEIKGARVFDLCAAPGGKTMQLAAAGARVTAVDIGGHRLKRVQENLTRVDLRAETIKEDVLDWAPDELADAILLDAPCSATGTIRRHPDILWSKSADDVEGLASLQSKMIDKALALLKPGGTLVFATCSLQPEEGAAQIEDALGRHEGLSRRPVRADEIGGLAEAITKDGDIRTLPSMLGEVGGMDGFFAARLVKAR